MQKVESKKESVKLLCCPFCGGEAETENRHNRYTDWWEVKCTDCNASLNERYEYEFEAVAAWNTRKPMEAVVAELEKESKEYEKRADENNVDTEYTRYYAISEGLDKAISIVRGKE